MPPPLPINIIGYLSKIIYNCSIVFLKFFGNLWTKYKIQKFETLYEERNGI